MRLRAALAFGVLVVTVTSSGSGRHTLAVSRPVTGTLASAADRAGPHSTAPDTSTGIRQRHAVRLDAGHYVRLSVEHTGIDVAAALIGPDGSTLADITYREPEALTLSAIARASGEHHVEIWSLDRHATGRYVVVVRERRAALAVDRHRVLAEQRLRDGDRRRADWRVDAAERILENYHAAREHAQAAHDRRAEARALTRLGETEHARGRPDAALAFFVASHDLAERTSDDGLACAALHGAARVSLDLGHISDATRYAEQALRIGGGKGHPACEVDALIVLGDTEAFTGGTRQSLTRYRRALERATELRDRRRQARARLSLGYSHSDLSEVADALAHYEAAAGLSRDADDQRGLAATLTALGHLRVIVGEHDQALASYRQAAEIIERMGDKVGRGMILSGIASVHFRAGDAEGAVEYQLLAARLFKEASHKNGEATSRLQLGRSLTALRRYDDALENYRAALTLFRDTGDRRLEARAMERIASVHGQLRDFGKARASYQAARSLAQAVGDVRAEVYALNGTAEALSAEGKYGDAVAALNDAASLSGRAHDRFSESLTQYNWARAEAGLGRLEPALARVQASLRIVEGLRGDVASLDLRSSYLASVRDRYELETDLLMALHARDRANEYLVLGFEASERARARSLLDALARAQAGIREGASPALLDRQASARRALNALAQRWMQSQTDPARATEAQALADALDKQTAAYRELEAQLLAESPRYGSLMQPQPLKLSQVQPLLLDDRTVLLQYMLGPVRSYVWAVTRRAVAAYALPPRDDIAARVRAYGDAVKAAASGAEPAVKRAASSRSVGGLTRASAPVQLERAGRALSDMLLAPVAPYLTSTRIVVVADGILHLLPFAALPDPRAAAKPKPVPLVVEHEIVNLPSASTLALLRGAWNQEGRWKKTAMVFGDPVYEADDPRITARDRRQPAAEPSIATTVRGGRIARLRATRNEARAIASLAAPADLALDFDANRARAVSSALADYRIVHFAAHGAVQDRRPELSGIVLSLFDRAGQPQDGFLRLHDIYNLKVPADLVVLSACSTALGKDVGGEGLIGLVRGFMYAGARRVVASLWEVDDEATRELMTRFYRGMLEKKLTPPAALRAAQVDLMTNTKWKSPFYWAAFVLQGDWN